MAKTTKRGASHQDRNAPAHFVPLAVIIDEYDGVLGQYISATGAGDVVVTMPVTVDVARDFRISLAERKNLVQKFCAEFEELGNSTSSQVPNSSPTTASSFEGVPSSLTVDSALDMD